MMQEGTGGAGEGQAKGACEGQARRGTGVRGCRCCGGSGAGPAGHGTLMLACFFQSVICIGSVAGGGGEMVVEEGGPGPSKPAGDRHPRQREKKDKEQDKQQVCEGFSIKAMMKNSVVGLLLA